MRLSVVSGFAIALSLGFAGGALAALTPGQRVQSDLLAKRMIATMAQTPQGADEGVYEAQLAGVIVSSDQPCPVVFDALIQVSQTHLAPGAVAAIIALRPAVQQCQLSGTSALRGNGPLAFGTGPGGGGGGGGSDYRQ